MSGVRNTVLPASENKIPLIGQVARLTDNRWTFRVTLVFAGNDHSADF